METLKNWERGAGVPTIRYMPKILKVLGYDPEPVPQRLADLIVHLRRLIGFTQKGLAKAIAVNPATVYNWEKGFTTPSVEKLVRLQNLAPAWYGLIRQ